MTKLDLQTPDFVAANAARLAELFPNCVTETKQPDGTLKRAIDFDLLRQELAYDLVEGPQERYRLDWPGKREALALANAPIRKTLRPCKDESVDFDTTQNLYIEGDNLDALKLLQETYLGKVKMIYIDPPYNTGNDFIYDDNFSISGEEHDLLSGTRDEEGNAMFQEEKWKQNSSASGRFHSEWLSMIYPRLKLARNFLRDDGVIFISINDIEVPNLRKVCDEVFGASSFIGQLIWHSKKGGGGGVKTVVTEHEYIVAYAKGDPEAAVGRQEVEAQELDLEDESGPYRKSRELNKWGAGSSRADRPTMYFPIPGPNGEDVYPIRNDGSEGRWRLGKKAMLKIVADNNALFERRADGSYIVFEKIRTSESRYKSYRTILSESGTASDGTSTLKELFDGRSPFDFPKPTQLLIKLFEIGALEDEDIMLDFFSGSATAAHAVMQLNAEDGGNRRHIMVQLPEPCDAKSEASKASFKTIAEVGKERIRRAGKKILEEWEANQASSAENLKLHAGYSDTSPPDIGFRVLKIDSSNMADVYYQPDELTQDGLMLHVDNLRPGRKPEDLLFQVLLDWGVDLALPITEETILKRRVFFVADNALAACFDTGLDEGFVKELAKRQPLRAVFRDSGYASDAVKINFEQIFKALSPHTELKTL